MIFPPKMQYMNTLSTQIYTIIIHILMIKIIFGYIIKDFSVCILSFSLFFPFFSVRITVSTRRPVRLVICCLASSV